MPLFGRRRRSTEPEPTDPAAPDESAAEISPESADQQVADAGDASVPHPDEPAPDDPAPEDLATLGAGPLVGAKPTGPVPRDAADAGPHEEVLDLGALRLPTGEELLEGIEIQLQQDGETGAVLSLLLVDGPEKALEIRAFAAPRHESLWDEVRAEIAAEAATAGGLSQAADGRWGTELLVQVAVKLPDGQDAIQVTRFVGIDGPRWFLRGAFLGRAAIEPDTAERLDALLAGMTVVRGDAAMAPRDALPLVLPGQPVADPAALDGAPPPLAPFERGPEHTEIR